MCMTVSPPVRPYERVELSMCCKILCKAPRLPVFLQPFISSCRLRLTLGHVRCCADLVRGTAEHAVRDLRQGVRAAADCAADRRPGARRAAPPAVRPTLTPCPKP